MNIGETLELGPYTVRCGMRPDNPAWPVFLVYRGEKLVGRQFSMPSRGDCESLQSNATVHAFGAPIYKKPKLRGAAAEASWRRKAAA